jgi:hypothetical protein
MFAPGGRIGPATDAERREIRAASLIGGKYEKLVDRESAYEHLLKRAEAGAVASAGKAPGQPAAADGCQGADDGLLGSVNDFLFGSTGPRGGRREGLVQAVVKSMARRTATQLMRGILGSLTGRR